MRIPDIWKREIAAGTPFGVRAAKAIENLRAVTSRPAPLQQSPVAVAGDAILVAIEAATGIKVSCNKCLEYLALISTEPLLDCEEITATLAAVLPLSVHIREIHNTQQKRQEWLRPIVTAALLDWVQP